MAVAVKPATTKIIAVVIGSVIALSTLILGMRTALTRAVDEAPQAVAVGEISSTSAVVSWETGSSVQGAVKYGKGPNDADLTSIAPELEPTKEHKVELTLLESGTTYYFKIIGGTDTDFDNSGSPWTFSTTSDDGSIPTSSETQRKISPIQRLVIEEPTDTGESTGETPTINCPTETNCELIKANFDKGCSTSDYVRCMLRPTTAAN